MQAASKSITFKHTHTKLHFMYNIIQRQECHSPRDTCSFLKRSEVPTAHSSIPCPIAQYMVQVLANTWRYWKAEIPSLGYSKDAWKSIRSCVRQLSMYILRHACRRMWSCAYLWIFIDQLMFLGLIIINIVIMMQLCKGPDFVCLDIHVSSISKTVSVTEIVFMIGDFDSLTVHFE